jgi:hypothetical protein
MLQKFKQRRSEYKATIQSNKEDAHRDGGRCGEVERAGPVNKAGVDF